jgi:flavin-dependent dehydrogenase
MNNINKVLEDKLINNNEINQYNKKWREEIRSRSKNNYDKFMALMSSDESFAKGVQEAYNKNVDQFKYLIANLQTNNINDIFIKLLKEGKNGNPMYIWG